MCLVWVMSELGRWTVEEKLEMEGRDKKKDGAILD